MQKINRTIHLNSCHIYGNLKMKKNESATENSMMERSFNIGWKMGENVSTHNSSY